MIRYASVSDLEEDYGEYGIKLKTNREDVKGLYFLVVCNSDNEKDRFGKMGGTISFYYKNECLYQRAYDAVVDTGVDLVSLPPFPCVEDYRIVKEKLYSFWRDKG